MAGNPELPHLPRRVYPVISVDGIRPIAPPEPPLGTIPAAEGLAVSSIVLPFELDERDPILSGRATTSPNQDRTGSSHETGQASLQSRNGNASEETGLLGRLENRVLRPQEQDLMRRLEGSIRDMDATAMQLDSKTSKVSHVCTPWDDYYPPPEPLPEARPTNTSVAREASLVMEVHDEMDYPVRAKKSLPKYCGMGRLLFTRMDFYNCVTFPLETEWKKQAPLARWSVSLQERKKSYKLTYGGPVKFMDQLSQRIEKWLQYRIDHRNLENILADGESLEVDVDINSSEHLGGECQGLDPSLNLNRKQQLGDCEGLWFVMTNPDEGLPRVLGQNAFEPGCAILAVNGKPVTNQVSCASMSGRTTSFVANCRRVSF